MTPDEILNPDETVPPIPVPEGEPPNDLTQPDEDADDALRQA